MFVVSLKSPASRIAWTGVAVLGLTAIHHAYGAAIYDAAFRSHVVLVALPVGAALLALAWGAERLGGGARRWSGRLLVGLALLFPVLGFGVFEGVYNHGLRLALFASGDPGDLASSLFPAGLYEVPSDVWFELTGLAQILAAAALAWRLWRDTPHVI
jgi:hypothetical protein